MPFCHDKVLQRQTFCGIAVEKTIKPHPNNYYYSNPNH